MALPPYAPTALGELFKLSDDLLWLAGDLSNDTAWYTRRAALATVYASAELFMTRDSSPSFSDTEIYVDRSLGSGAGAATRDLGNWLGFAARASINILRSKSFHV